MTGERADAGIQRLRPAAAASLDARFRGYDNGRGVANSVKRRTISVCDPKSP